ncbi:nucleotide-diphosphate-sugar epimerase [Siminovitchia terrae]|uniref:NmrA family NAD(P)-binding protein n=1 Tax=Siminovitchia terrae TaxID=1914933 RepID=UPI001B1376BE|nr:NmrA family NAD(P)-binding protein [Siminovitchia terrae]GIN93720.1 nucleotide-diphosphate-sugar epimerase [Siminovitchia terrae]
MSTIRDREILILGATGTVGSLVAKELESIKEIVRLGSRSRPHYSETMEHFFVDVMTGEGLVDALAGIRKLFLITPDMDDQLGAELRIVEAAVKAGVEHIVKVSAFGAAREDYMLGRIHRSVEMAIESSGTTWTFLRPTAFMQNFSIYYLPSIQSVGVVRLPCGDTPVSFIDACNIATMVADALLNPTHVNRSYEMFGPEALSYSQAAQELSKSIGIEIRYEAISDAEYQSETGISSTHRILDLYRYYRSGHAMGEPFNMLAHKGRELRRLRDFAVFNREVFV